MEIEKDNLLRRPYPMKAPPSTHNKNKYCRFHRDHGHDTENYYALKNEIEELIRRGYLGKFVRQEGDRTTEENPSGPSTQIEEDNRPTEKIINMIF